MRVFKVVFKRSYDHGVTAHKVVIHFIEGIKGNSRYGDLFSIEEMPTDLDFGREI